MNKSVTGSSLYVALAGRLLFPVVFPGTSVGNLTSMRTGGCLRRHLKHRADNIRLDVAFHTDQRSSGKLNVDRALPALRGARITLCLMRRLICHSRKRPEFHFW